MGITGHHTSNNPTRCIHLGRKEGRPLQIRWSPHVLTNDTEVGRVRRRKLASPARVQTSCGDQRLVERVVRKSRRQFRLKVVHRFRKEQIAGQQNLLLLLLELVLLLLLLVEDVEWDLKIINMDYCG